MHLQLLCYSFFVTIYPQPKKFPLAYWSLLVMILLVHLKVPLFCFHSWKDIFSGYRLWADFFLSILQGYCSSLPSCTVSDENSTSKLFSRVKNILLFFSLCFEDLLSCLWFSVVWPWCAFVQNCLCLFYLMSSEHVLSIHFCLFSNLGTFLSFLGFPYGSAGKESTCNVGDLGLIPELGRSPGEGKGYPLQYSGLENSMESPWSCKESDTTERLSLHFTSVIFI